MIVRFDEGEFTKLKKLLAVYEWGLKALMTKLTIIHEDLKNFQENYSIEHIVNRIKAPESIAAKLQRMGLGITAANAQGYLRDIAGVRIICPFAKDIYFLVDLLKSIPDIEIVEEKDFASKPKPSGYRSYHLIVDVPVFFSGETENVKVEIQIRTAAMDFWATLEHKARYKYRYGNIPQHLSDELVEIADKIDELDYRMFTIHEEIMSQNGH